MLASMRKAIKKDLLTFLDVINEKEPELKAKFYLLCARLKANINQYSSLKGVKKELTILEESLDEDE